MTEIQEHDPNASPSGVDDSIVSNGNGLDANRGTKRPRPAQDDDDDDDDKPGRERRKIEIKFIQDKSRRHITFSKRKAGIMKKAYELSVLTGTQVLLLVVSETGLVYTFTTPKLQPLVTKPEGKNLIQACLNAPEPASADSNGVDGDQGVDSPEDNTHAQMPQGQPRGMPQQQGMPAAYMTPEQHLQYQTYLQQQQASGHGYMPQQGRMPTHPQHSYPPDQKLS
ncbi:SRF-TF-domain-containing protein [Pseudovirgaria hyperparasitica]|uniref:SRF-TF-domain-containing protein n=1 Tax=Pseudovirgaria hyperparasitica TaxID=470096 RepID=A0A6A6WHX4_9PEZI|nr:SRF-TF-domain-containing protein [Pseudovirgaria hyperparasitica]KAF2762398.1 SRF-TF-domain-containing protein [Pseudovirgaria hyperparasitica]